MNNSSNNLYKCADDVQDYFRRLGGSNQYSGFMNWHIPAFLLLIYQNKIESEVLPSAIWQNTKELQDTTKSRLLSNPPTTDDISEFIDRTTKLSLIFKDKREHLEWANFCKSNFYL
jgi:Fic family protein